MTYYNILLLTAIVLSIAQLVIFYQLRKHDKVLYRICQIRRQAMMVLRKRGTDLSKDDYNELRLMIEAMNSAIFSYKDYKTVIFNWRKMRAYFEQYKASTKDLTTHEPKDAEILEIRNGLIRAIMRGFIAYTPLLWFELRYDFAQKFFRWLAGVLAYFRFLKESPVGLLDEAKSTLASDIRRVGYPNNSLRHRHCDGLE